ncbi:hypothetical protein C8Q75DRAFT_763129 [Abortiporus biennis]|nr:hypothetical protein C8Q75DRAFT_763129 [Abortiporus biennis]
MVELRGTFYFLSLLYLANAFTFTVTVGIDETNGHQGIGFDPSAITPAVGDTIAFTYQLPSYIKSPASTQHSATQSTFDDPCTPMAGGFDTGVQSTGSANDNTGSTFELLVNDTQPLWFFSSVGDDCKSGMVLAVNPPTSGDQTAAAFKAKAEASSGSPATTSPAASSPATSGSSTPTTTGTGTGTGTGTAAPSTSSSPTSGAASKTAQLDLAFAGIVALIGVALAA